MPDITSTTLTRRPLWVDAALTFFQSTAHPIEDEENEGYFDGTSEYFDADDADEDDDEPRDEDGEDEPVVEDEDDLG